MCFPTSLRFAALGLVTVAALTGTAFAQLPPGKDCYAFPAGGKVGRAVEVRLGGSDWTPDVQFFVFDRRVKLEVLGPPSEVLMPEPPFWFGIKSFSNDPFLPREVPVRIHLPPDLPPGPVRWAAANANGAGAGGVFWVGTGDEVTEDENRRGPQNLASLPVTINGRLRRIEEVDRYRFQAATNGLVTCDLLARRLGNDFNGVLEAFEGDRKIAEVLDTEGTDPALTFPVQKGHFYTVTVRDIDHRGFRNFTYRLTLTPGPRIVTAVPAAGRRGAKRSVEFVGVGIATGQPRLERLMKEIAFPKDAAASFPYRLETPHGVTPPFAPQLTDSDERIEPAATDPNARRLPVGPPSRGGPSGAARLAAPTVIPVPGAITGRIERRGERDAYTFTGKKGELWDVSVQARKIGSPLDAALIVLGPDGKQLAAADDAGTSTDPHLLLTLPADGTYQVIVRDVSGQNPDLDFVYRLVIQRPASGFHLRTLEVVNIPIGGKAALKVDLERAGTFKGPVALTVTGLPEGVTVPGKLVILANAATLMVPLECAKTAAAAAALVQITGTATVENRPATATACVAHGDDLVPGVLVATTMKPPFKVKSPDADNTRKAPRGATHLADLRIERTDGFTGPIILDMAGSQSRHRQGIRGPALTVAPGQSRVLYPAFLPEWLESTRTSRIGLVAMARIPDPKGSPRWVLTPMEGQITMSIEGALMKLAHTADEITAVCGEAVDVPLKLARAPQIVGPVRVELAVPPELAGLVSAAPLTWPNSATTATLRLVSKNDPRLAGTWKLTARATGVRDGHPVVSETEIEVEFTHAVKSGAKR